MTAADALLDPLRIVEEAIASGARSVSKADLVRLFGISERSLERAKLPRFRVGGQVYFEWEDVRRMLVAVGSREGGDRQPTTARRRRKKPISDATREELKRFGINV